MKYTALFIALFSIWIWQAHSSGPGQVQDRDRTGGPLASGFCGNCHSGGDFGTALSLTLHDELGDTIKAYQPGAKYELRMKVTGAGAAGFGFQAVALASDSSSVGTYGMPAAGSQLVTINGREYFEHSATSSTGEWNIEWTAPDSAIGDLTFYFAGNAVNGAGNRTGDHPTHDSHVISQDVISKLVDVSSLGLKIAPNPILDQTQISWSSQVKVHQVDLFDFQGKSVLHIDVQPGAHSQLLNLSQAAPGLYQVMVRSSEGVQSSKVLKL